MTTTEEMPNPLLKQWAGQGLYDPESGDPIPPTPSIYQIIPRIIAEMKGITKDSKNEQQNYSFRGIDDVIRVLHPLLGEHGCFLVPDAVERQVEERRTKSGTLMNTVHLHMRFRVYGPRGDYVEGSTWGEGTDTGDKATTKAHTMAFKYFLFETFAVSDPESDSDKTSPEATVSRRVGRQKAVNAETGEIEPERKVAPSEVRNRLKARIDALSDAQKAQLLVEWRDSKISKIAELTVEEVTAVGKLIDKVKQVPAGEVGTSTGGDSPPPQPTQDQDSTKVYAEDDPQRPFEDPNAITPKQRGMIYALGMKHEWDHDQTQAMVGDHLGREIHTMTQLSKKEASQVIDWLNPQA